LEEKFVDEGGRDVILPEEGSFEIKIVLPVEVAGAQVILGGACWILGRVVTLLTASDK
jgi:hypothetical protein